MFPGQHQGASHRLHLPPTGSKLASNWLAREGPQKVHLEAVPPLKPWFWRGWGRQVYNCGRNNGSNWLVSKLDFRGCITKILIFPPLSHSKFFFTGKRRGPTVSRVPPKGASNSTRLVREAPQKGPQKDPQKDASNHFLASLLHA